MLKLDQIQDVETLRQAARLLEAENQRLVGLVIKLREEIASLKGQAPESLQQQLALLEQQLAQRNAALFGPSSERRDGAQTHGTKNESKDTDGRKSRKGHGPRVQPALPIVEQRHELPETERVCEQCGGALVEMSGQTEDSEEIDVVERHFVVRKHRRAKYRCSCNACIKAAPAPLKIVPGGHYSIGFAIEVAVQKYAYHMPLARIARQMGHEGLTVDTQTLWDQIEQLGRVLFRVPAQIKSRVLANGVLGVDETRWPLMSDSGKLEGQASNWYAWAISAPDAVHYTIAAGRSTHTASSVLDGFTGVAMADGYDVYESLAKRRGGAFTVAHCWVHVRRKFVEIEKFFPERCAEAIAMIGELYAIEKKANTGPPEERLARLRTLRETESRDVVQRIQKWAIGTGALPQSGLGRALAYMGDCWKGLVRFLDDPRIPLDNNSTEQALRGPVVGRKNHYGSRSRRGTEIAALYYTLIESAKRNGVDPRRYLRHATDAALRNERVMLPHEYASAIGRDDADSPDESE
ncbi:MAG: IS66 family transposase [Candidatus Dormibacteraeota bacterium]|nr:IS66 family transposase [Candidatus Dormibacteraeota bacterium]